MHRETSVFMSTDTAMARGANTHLLQRQLLIGTNFFVCLKKIGSEYSFREQKQGGIVKKFTGLLLALILLCFFQTAGRSSGKNNASSQPHSGKGSLGTPCHSDNECDKELACKANFCVPWVTGGEIPGEPMPQGGGGNKGGKSGTPHGGNPSGTAPLTGDPNHLEGYYRSVWTCTCNPDIGGPPIVNDDESISFKPVPKDKGGWIMYYDITNGGFIYQGGTCSIERSGGIAILCDKCSVSGKTVTFKPCRTEGCVCDSVWTKIREFEKD